MRNKRLNNASENTSTPSALRTLSHERPPWTNQPGKIHQATPLIVLSAPCSMDTFSWKVDVDILRQEKYVVGKCSSNRSPWKVDRERRHGFPLRHGSPRFASRTADAKMRHKLSPIVSRTQSKTPSSSHAESAPKTKATGSGDAPWRVNKSEKGKRHFGESVKGQQQTKEAHHKDVLPATCCRVGQTNRNLAERALAQAMGKPAIAPLRVNHRRVQAPNLPSQRIRLT